MNSRFSATSRISLCILALTLMNAASAKAAAAGASLVETPDQVRAFRLEAPVDLDGRLLEAAWQRPGETRLVQNDPDNGAVPRQKTEFWVGYDDQALYLAARMWDSAPDSIATRLGRRDTWPASDWIYLNLDTFNDDRNAFSFSINPSGVIGDSALYNDGWGDASWDGVWEAETDIDDQGWTLEVRIPFSQLKFPEQEEQVWGLNFSRRILRYNERDELFHTPRGESGYGRRFPDLVGIRGITPGSKAEIRAFGLLKGEFLDVDPEDPFRDDRQLGGNAGLDVKTALSNNLTMNATVNPDFGQVEVDPAVVNLGAYETFFEEKRPFFVEDANIFRFGQEGTNSNWNFNWMDPMLFYSRRVGRSPQIGIEGSPDWVDRPDFTTILGATKVSGKVGNTSVGAFSAVTAREKAHLQTDGTNHDQVVEPLTSYSVVRAKYAKPDGSAGLGVLATSVIRDLDDPVSQAALDRRSFTGGLDGFAQLDEDGVWALKGYLAGSHITGSAEAIDALQTSSRHSFDRPDADHLTYDPLATSLKGWQGRLALNKESGNWRFNTAAGYSSPGYEINDIGFAFYTDVINTSLVGGYSWREPNKLFRNQSVFFDNLQDLGHRRHARQRRVRGLLHGPAGELLVPGRDGLLQPRAQQHPADPRRADHAIPELPRVQPRAEFGPAQELVLGDERGRLERRWRVRGGGRQPLPGGAPGVGPGPDHQSGLPLVPGRGPVLRRGGRPGHDRNLRQPVRLLGPGVPTVQPGNAHRLDLLAKTDPPDLHPAPVRLGHEQ